MNKVFKVIWSEARNAYVVVSEMAKSHGTKSCSTKKLLAMLIAAGIMTCASAAPVMAENVPVGVTKIQIGDYADADDHGVAIGNKADADDYSVAIGANSVADRSDVVSVGSSDLTRQIINVAAGTELTDAVNVEQLNAATKGIAGNTQDIIDIKQDIVNNKNLIENNATDIDANKANIVKNAQAIDANKANIVKNAQAIDANKANIVKNAQAIDANKANIVKNAQAIDANKANIVKNAQAIDANKANIVKNAQAIDANKANIVKNAQAIDVNKANIATNKADIAQNKADIATNRNRINQLGSRVNKVGAGAAALAALHPMDFDPDDKWSFAAGMGNYAGQNAAAIGAFYRPDEKVMFSVGGTVGNGENMVNAGISFALDRTNHVSNSRTALAREVIDLRGQLAVMGAKMAKMEKALGMLDETKTKLFPDVPANHWAYEYIAKLAGNGYIEGYPDGNFGGDRLMTRYEFAAMLYRAIENGAALEEKIIKEFEPELGRIRVDRISGEDGDRDKIERVRVNDTKGERDHYGNKLAK